MYDKDFSSWTIAGWLLGTHWMKLVPLDIVSMVKYLHGWCVVLKSDLDSQYRELESKFGDSFWNHLSEVWQFTFYYYMVYSQITVGNVTLHNTLLTTKWFFLVCNQKICPFLYNFVHITMKSCTINNISY